jgi:hypothetical protein
MLSALARLYQIRSDDGVHAVKYAEPLRRLNQIVVKRRIESSIHTSLTNLARIPFLVDLVLTLYQIAPVISSLGSLNSAHYVPLAINNTLLHAKQMRRNFTTSVRWHSL